ncbi:MAG: DUF1565 domain-containing protein [Thainema sp.]
MNSSHRSAIGQSVIWLAGMAFSVGVGESAIAQVPDSSNPQPAPEPIASAPSGTENTVHAASNVTVLHVNSVAGQDQSGSGESNAPFRSLTHALQMAQPNTVIVLAPGTYSASNGESFPIQLKSGVTIQGNPANSGQDVIIKGGGLHSSPAFGEQNVTLVGADQAGLTGVTVTNTDPKGYGLWIESTSPIVVNNTFHANGYDGVAVAGRANPMLRSNLFAGNGASGVSLFGEAGGTLRNNTFDSNSFGVNIAHQARPILVGNRILRNRDGIVVQDEARPALQVNIIEGQERDGLVARANAQPNLGTPDQAGGNIFRSNGRLDINAEAVQTPIPVYGSQFEASAARGKIDVTGAIALNANAPVTPTSNPFNTTLAEMSRTNQVSVTPINPVTSSTTLPNSAAANAVTPSPTLPSTTASASTSTTQAAPASQAGTSGAAPQTSQAQASRTPSVPPISTMDAWIQNPSAERPAAVSAALETAANASEPVAEEADTVAAESVGSSEAEQVAIAAPPPPATPTSAVAEEAAPASAASPSEAVNESDSSSDSNQIAIRIPTPTLPTVNSSPTVEPAAPDATEAPVEPESASGDQAATSEPASETTSEESSPAAATVAETPRGGAASRPLVTEITIEPILEPAAAQAAAANLEETTDEPVAVSPTSEDSAVVAADVEAEQADPQVAVRPAAESASDSLVTEVEFTAPSTSSIRESASASESSEPAPTLSAAPASTPPTTAADLQLPAQPVPEVSAARTSVDTATASAEAPAEVPADEAVSTETEPEATPLPTITSQVTVADSTSVPAIQDAPANASTARSQSQLPAAPANAPVINNVNNDTLALVTPPQNLTSDQPISIPVPTPDTAGSGANLSDTATPAGWPSLLHDRQTANARRSDNLAAVISSDTSETTSEATTDTPAASSAEAPSAEAVTELTIEPAAAPETIAAAPAETVRSLEFSIDAVQDIVPENSQQTMPEATEVVDEDSSSVETTAAETTEAASRTSVSRDHSDLATAIADRPFALRSHSNDQRSAEPTNASRDVASRDTEREFTIAARSDADTTIRDVTDTDAATPEPVDDADAVREFEFTAPTASPNAPSVSTPAPSAATSSTATRREPTLPRLPSRATREQVLAMTSNASGATGSLVSALATRSTTGTETSAISIPVSPAGGAAPGTTSTVPNGEAEQIARAIAEAEENALPVPSINIPLARSSVPAVNVSPNATRSPIDPPPPPTRASSLGLGYRLIVDAPSTAEQERLKQHVRDAFRVQYNGRSMMQAGAFRDRTEATAIMQMLQESGFSVILAE